MSDTKKEYKRTSDIDDVVKEWFENRSDWKLVLIKSDDNKKGRLLLGRLESSVNLENKKRRMKIDEKELSNSFRTNKIDVKNEISFLEIEKFINISISSSYKFLERLAIGILREFNKDYGVSLYTDISDTMVIKGSGGYSFDWNRLEAVLQKYKYKDEIPKDILEKSQSNSRIPPRLKILKRNKSVKKSQLVIDNNSKIKEYNFISYILDNWNITNDEKNVLYISENDNIDQYGKYCIGIDFDYFFRMD